MTTTQNIITHTSKTIIICPGRVKRNTPVMILNARLGGGFVHCRNLENGKEFICEKSDLRYFEEAGA